MKNQLKTALFLGVLTSILVGIGALVAPGYLWVFGALAVLLNVGSYFFSDRIVLAIHRAREVGPDEEPRLHHMVEELAARAGIPKPRVYILDQDTPNAFATGRNPAHGVVAVTTGIRRLLGERELRGVLAHEIAHIKNRDILITTVAAIIASIVSMIASALQWAWLLGGGRSDDEEQGSGVGAFLMAIFAPIAATVVQLAISRSREYLADQRGAEISGDPEALASALERLELGNRHIPSHAAETAPATASLFIVNPLRGGGVWRWFSTHPSTAERVRRLREMALGRRPSPRRSFRAA